MRLYVVQPLHKVLSEWDRCKGDFMTAIRPFMPNIEALDKLDDEIRELQARRENVRASIERRYEADRGYGSQALLGERTQ